MFDDLAIAPPDPILGLEEAFKNDPNPAKINLTAGVYRDETGNTPIFRAVKQAEAEILESEITKSYLGITGAPDFTAAVQGLIFGPGSPVLAAGRAITAHAPGGTGALRVAADFVRKANEHATVWISQPTWPNHPSMMKAVGLGWTGGMRFIDVSVQHSEKGKPSLILEGFAAEYAAELGATSAHVTLSHEKDMAIAVVILEGP